MVISLKVIATVKNRRTYTIVINLPLKLIYGDYEELSSVKATYLFPLFKEDCTLMIYYYLLIRHHIHICTPLCNFHMHINHIKTNR